MKQKIATAFMVFGLVLLAPGTGQATDWWSTAQQVLTPVPARPVPQTIAPHVSTRDMSSALREALRLGTEQVVKQLGARDGFNLDPKIHIPLPRPLQVVDTYLGKVGMSSLTDHLETKLNRAAEVATPRARTLFIKAITDMTFDDARAILTGPKDSATTYLRRSMGPELTHDMTPVVQQALNQVGAVQIFDQSMGRYNAMPFAPKINTDLKAYVVEKALDGIFYYVAQQEATIRQDPARQTTALLKRVFGAMISR